MTIILQLQFNYLYILHIKGIFDKIVLGGIEFVNREQEEKVKHVHPWQTLTG